MALTYMQKVAALDHLRCLGCAVKANLEVQKFDDFLALNQAHETGWTDLPTEEQMEAALAALNDTVRKDAIKAKAGTLILSQMPIWKQNNYQARFQFLMFKELKGIELSLGEQTDQTTLLAIWGWVEAVRGHSNELEADPNLSESWPAWNDAWVVTIGDT